MGEYKILQLLTTSVKLNAIFIRKGIYGNSRYEEAYPIVGMALVEDKKSHRYIKLLITNDKGLVTYLEEDLPEFYEVRPASKGLMNYAHYENVI